MSTTPFVSPRPTSQLATTTGAVGLLGIVCITLFYSVGGIFGPLNDLCNAVLALLSAGLAWRLRRSAPPDRAALGAAGLGAAIAVVGSALVMSGRTGWYLAGLYTSLGYAFLGLWVWRVNSAVRAGLAWPRRLVQFGRLTGALMALGFLALPGIVRGVDSAETAPWWAHAGFVGGLGWFLLYPIWCLWLGRALARPAPEG